MTDVKIFIPSDPGPSLRPAVVDGARPPGECRESPSWSPRRPHGSVLPQYQPLQSSPSESGSSGDDSSPTEPENGDNEDIPAHSTAHSEPWALSFYDSYEILNGVPTFVVKPSNEGHFFTCHAFSPDGSLLAAGEENGQVRLWCTSCYTQMLDIPSLNGQRVRCLSFLEGRNDVIITLENPDLLRIIDVTHPQVCCMARTEKGKRDPNVWKSSEWKLCLNGVARWAQFSDDGTVLALRVNATQSEAKWTHHLYQIKRNQIECAELDRAQCVLLSGNGKHVMGFVRTKEKEVNIPDEEAMAVYKQPEVLIWTALEFKKADDGWVDGELQLRSPVTSPAAYSYKLDGERGRWGRGGEYFLIWTRTEQKTGTKNQDEVDRTERRPLLRIYKTSDLVNATQNSKPDPFTEKELDLGLRFWDAQILDEESEESALLVAIYEVYGDKNRRLLIWNVTDDKTENEIHVRFELNENESVFGNEEKERWNMCLNQVEELPEKGVFSETTGKRAYDWMLAYSMRPKFVVSKDLSIACFFSLSYQTVNISSLESGASLWNFSLPSELKINPFSRHNTCLFHPSGKRLMVLGREAVMTFAPPCLDLESQPQYQVLDVSKKPCDPCLWTDAFGSIMRCLPSVALSRWVSDLLDSSIFRDYNIEGRPNSFPDNHRIVDSAISPDGNRIFFIRAERESFKNYTIEKIPARADPQQNSSFHCKIEEFKKLPTNIDSTPRHVFMYGNCRTSRDTLLVICGTTENNTACFYDCASHEPTYLDFQMTCLTCTQTEDGRYVLLLSARTKVLILDLKEKTKRAIKYAVDFEKVVKTCHLSRWKEWLQPHSKIAADGKSVLIGWDNTNEKSMMVTTETTQDDWKACIQQANKQISPQCILSDDGNWVVHLDDAGSGTLRVGLYNNKDKAIHRHVRVGQLPGCGGVARCDVSNLRDAIWFAVVEKGKELALVNSNAKGASAHRIVRVTPYGDQRCLPSYDASAHCDEYTNRSLKKELLQRWFKKYHSCVFNMTHPPGRSFFEDALHAKDKDSIATIQALAADNGFSLCLKPKKPSNEDSDSDSAAVYALCNDSLLKQRSDIKDWMQTIRHMHICFNRCATLMKNTFIEIWLRSPRSIEEQFKKEITVDVHDLDVHADFFQQTSYPGVYLETADTTMEWFLNGDRESRNKNWRRRHEEMIAGWEMEGDKSTVTAKLKIVRLADIAKVGMKGILRRLLLTDAPARFFALDPVKWTILLKWEKHWKDKCRSNVWKYALFVLFFSIYAGFIGSKGDVHEEPMTRKIIEAVLLIIFWCFAMEMGCEELSQIKSLTDDGKTYLNHWMTGLKYYLGSKWNWVQLSSCLILLLVIPTLHIISAFDSRFHMIFCTSVALESILVWFQIWYHMQPFQPTGAMVLMIGNIVVESFWFLVLAGMLLVGFSLTFHVLFKNMPTDEDHQEYHKLVHEYFGTFPRSAVTLFFALFSNFPTELYLPKYRVSIMICSLFCLYVLIESVVLLNLLIAIMGDTFDKIKEKEENQLLKGRAAYVDACEAAMSQAQIDEMEKTIGTYLIALVPTEPNPRSDDEWTGRLNSIRQMINDALGEQRSTIGDELSKLQLSIDQALQKQSNAHQMQEDDLRSLRRMQEETQDNLREVQADVRRMQEETQDNLREVQADVRRMQEETQDNLRLMHENLTAEVRAIVQVLQQQNNAAE